MAGVARNCSIHDGVTLTRVLLRVQLSGDMSVRELAAG